MPHSGERSVTRLTGSHLRSILLYEEYELMVAAEVNVITAGRRVLSVNHDS